MVCFNIHVLNGDKHAYAPTHAHAAVSTRTIKKEIGNIRSEDLGYHNPFEMILSPKHSFSISLVVLG
jgi:hypothetical protein